MAANFVVESSNVAEFPLVDSFDDMGLSEPLLRGVYAYGYEKPSPIQQAAIVPQIRGAGRDLMGQAQSGTGKTGAFVIGSLGRVDVDMRAVQVLVLCHTRELADQTAKVFRGLGLYMKIKVVVAVGGDPRHLNVRDIQGGAHVVVGTPGRVYDLASKNVFDFSRLKSFILDEADEMLRDRFAEQVGEIFKLGVPPSCRVSFFSATLPDEVRELAGTILQNPVHVTLKTAEVKLDGIKQYYVVLEDESWKLDAFRDIFESLPIESSIVFCNTKERAERLHRTLTENGFPVSVIYGEMEQADRKARMDEFRRGTTRVLIATNLLARGIDVQQVSVVFNFDMPPFEDKENYIHRIGRCGRFGRKGVAISLLTPSEKDVMDQIAHHYEFAPVVLPEEVKTITSA